MKHVVRVLPEDEIIMQLVKKFVVGLFEKGGHGTLARVFFLVSSASQWWWQDSKAARVASSTDLLGLRDLVQSR